MNADRIRETIRNHFGSVIADETNLTERACWQLARAVPGKPIPEDLTEKLEHQLFDDLYTALGSGMNVTLQDGTRKRIRLDEIADTADELTGILLESIRVSPAGYDTVRSFYMRSGSFHAMRLLYTRYGSYLGPGERQLMETMIRKDYPEYKWKEWLDGGNAK